VAACVGRRSGQSCHGGIEPQLVQRLARTSPPSGSGIDVQPTECRGQQMVRTMEHQPARL
jgi:hypothetical protein